MTELLNYIHSFSEFSKESWDTLLPILTKVEFKKGEFLLEVNKPCDSLYFICKGFCRAFNLQNGEEVNTAFFFETDIATHMNSYIFENKSTFAIQACEPVIAIKFDKAKVLAVSKVAPEIELIAKRNLQLIAAKQEKQLQLYRILTAEGRYAHIEKSNPEMLRRVSLTLLSSYLGVKRETLSRIRNKRL